MTIPIFSDSHGEGYRAEYVFERLKKFSDYPKTALFLGDGARDIEDGIPNGCELLSVAGNCDVWTSLFDDQGNEIPDERIEFFEGLKIFMTHGHKYYVKTSLVEAIRRARELDADILLFGHTHQPLLRELPADEKHPKRLIMFNPGSLRAGSFGLLTVVNGTPLLSHGEI